MTDAVTIGKAFEECGSDKHKHGYHVYYESIFDNEIDSILEIGIKNGGSHRAWRRLLPQARVAGMDINPAELGAGRYNELQALKVDCVFGDSTEPTQANRVSGDFDVIIDDGSHFYVDIMATFDNFKNKFKKYYIIEDLMYDCEGVVDYIKSKGFQNVEVFDSIWKVNVPVNERFLKYGDVTKDSTVPTIKTTLKWIKVTR